MSTILKYLIKGSLVSIVGLFAGNVYGANLDIANNALELSKGVEPNVMVLSDDSGSMDWGVIAPTFTGTFILYKDQFNYNRYFYTHPDLGVSVTSSPASNYYEDLSPYTTQDYSLYVTPTESALRNSGVASPYGGVWRMWSKDYNQIYYNPDITYSPWEGLNSNNSSYVNATPSAAYYNPYVPSQGSFDLTTTHSYQSACEQYQPCIDAGLTTDFSVTGFYPARYYIWTDTDSDGIVDEADAHQLVEIRASGCSVNATCPTSFDRPKYSDATGMGRSDCGTDNGDNTVTCSVAEELQNYANWFSYYRKRDLIAKAALSKTLNSVTFARIGYATINNNSSVNIGVESMNASAGSGAKKALLDSLFSTRPFGGTPLLDGLYSTGRYFECQSGDIFGSSGTTTPGSSSCPVEAAPKGTCQSNYTLIMTDGAYSDALSAANGNLVGNTDGPGSGNTSFDGGAFADGFDDTLADVAMHFYERDLHGSLNDEVTPSKLDLLRYPSSPVLDEDDRLHQHMSTYAIGFGVNGFYNSMPSDPSLVFPWPDPTTPIVYGPYTFSQFAKIDDLRHAAYNGRGRYLSARNPEQLADTISETFAEFDVGKGTSSSVAFNSQTIESDSLVFRAFFNSSENSGDLIAQRINADGTLNEDGDGNPIFEWSAAEQLDNKTSSTNDSRVIFTYEDNGSSSQGVAFQWLGSSTITVTQKTALNDPQPGNVILPQTVGEERLEYLRGHSVNEGDSFDDGEFRRREITAGKLGDIVHSTPVFVGEPPYTGRISGEYPGEYPNNVDDLYTVYRTDNQNRREIVYVGANDGMLHAFDATDGSEVFAYVPGMLFNKLSELSKPDYDHQFYVDLTPSVNDVFMNNGGFGRTWNSVLINGLRAGGKGYFALNISDPDDFSSESSAASQVMWEFTENDDGAIGNSDLGYTFSQPLIAMSNAEYSSGGDNRWVAIFGNGYNSTSADGDAALYILFIDEGLDGVWTAGSDFIKISTGNGKAESADGTTPNGLGGVRGIDVDGNGTVDRVYAGDLQGNLYRFDISGNSLSNWANSSNRDIIFEARYGTGFPRNQVQPITTRPIVVKHPDQGGHIVIFATGSWFTNDDAVSTDIQSIYGVWDDDSGNLVEMFSNSNQLVEQTLTNHSSAEHGFTVRTQSNNDVPWKNNGSTANQVKGWYIDLDVPPAGSTGAAEFPGERAVRNIQLRGGLLFVNTVIPKASNPCNNGPGGFELGFNPITGGSGEEVIFDINNDGVFDANDNVADATTLANIVTGIRFDIATPTDASFISNFRITQTSDKKVRSIKTNTLEAVQEGRNSWRELIIQ